MAALFTIAPKWKQPTRSPTDETMNKMEPVCKTEYHLLVRRNEVLLFVPT